MDSLQLQDQPDSVILTLKIVPGSSKTTLCGVLDGMLKIKIAAPPEKGKANKAVIAYLAKVLGIKKGDLTLVSGQTSPVKQVQIQGLTAQQIKEALCP